MTNVENIYSFWLEELCQARPELNKNYVDKSDSLPFNGRWLPRTRAQEGWPCTRWSPAPGAVALAVVVLVLGPQEAAAGPANLLSRDSHLKICISGIACRRAKRLLPTLTMKMVSFADADLADSKLILHRSKTNRRNSKLLALDKARCKFRGGLNRAEMNLERWGE